MTLREAYQTGIGKLTEAGIEEASLDAWYLLEYVTGVSRAIYLADAEREMDSEQESRYDVLIGKRAARIPLQHLTGVQEFMGLEFLVNEHVLIPRQDTETLVETALDILGITGNRDLSWLERLAETAGKPVCGSTGGAMQAEQQADAFRLLDLCTGSGCILLSILKFAEERKQFAGGRNGRDGTSKAGILWMLDTMQGTGTDISAEALAVACANKEHLNVNAEFLQSDLFEKVTGPFHMIVSNPPYIRTAVIEELQEEVKGHDPYLALDGREDGLYFYREIIRESGKYLIPGGYLLFEIGCDQAEDVSALMKQAGYREVTVKKDLAGLDRVVFGVYDIKELHEGTGRGTAVQS